MSTKKRRKLNRKGILVFSIAGIVLLLVIIGLFSMIFRGCSSSSDTPAADPAADTTTDVVTIGDKDTAAATVNLENQTGQAIISFKIRNSATEEFGENLLGDSRIKNKSNAVWYVPKSDDNSTVQVEITLANYTQFVIRDWKFSEYSGIVSILLKNETGYLEYKPKGSDSAVNTYDDEVAALAQEEEDKAKREAAAQQKANADAANETGSEEGTAEDSGQTEDTGEYTEDSGEYTDEGGYEDSWTDGVYTYYETYYCDEYGTCYEYEQ